MNRGTGRVYHQGFLSRIEQSLHAALPLWGLSDGADLSLLAISENATFRATDRGSGADIVLRVHRPGYHTLAEIESELAWIAALREEGALETLTPVPLAAGGLVASLDDGGTARHVVAFDFVPGEEPRPGDDDLPRWFRELGAAHARLHDHARRWPRPAGFTRKVWNFDTTLGRTHLWGDWRAALGLDAAGRTVLERTAAAIERRVAPLAADPARFGLVHADLRLANLIVAGDRLTLIDFDDCGFSWFLYDFASAVSFIEHEPCVPALLDAWIEGYRTIAPLSADDVALIPVLVMLRRMLLTAWIASHSETPTAASLGAAYTEGTVALAEAFLSGLC